MVVATVEGKWTAEGGLSNSFKGLMAAHEIFLGRNLDSAFEKAALSTVILPEKTYRLIIVEDEMYNS